jgi:hypothetical protein
MGSQETAMPMRRFEPIALTQFLVGGLAVAFGTCVLIKHAQAQFVNPPPPPPPPVFNPSSPNTVPQPSYTPLSPTTPSAVPGYRVTSPVRGRLPRTAATRSHRPTPVARTRSVHRRGRSTVAGPIPESYSYYYSPFGYGYGCAWRRTLDGYWFRTSPCS